MKKAQTKRGPHGLRVPALRLHKRSGNAYTRIDGRQVWLGPADDPATETAFHRLIAAWHSNGKRLPEWVEVERIKVEARGVGKAGGVAPYQVDELVADYLDYAASYYHNPTTGESGGEYTHAKRALWPLLDEFGSLAAREFGPLALRAVRERMIDGGRLCRKEINLRLYRIRRAFRWAASMEKVPAHVAEALRSVEGLRMGRTVARESEPVRPVSEHDVRATVAFLPPTVAAMVWLQWWCGCRPGEVVSLRGREIDRSGPVWIYRPEQHKTSWRGRDRLISIGPRAQEVLSPFLKLDPAARVFTPKAAELERKANKRAARKSKLTPSQRRRDEESRRNPKRTIGDAWDVHSYRRAIHRACDLAKVPRWSPNRLRHAAATRLRKEVGLEAARVVLGHAQVAVTEVYAEVDHQQSLRIMERLG